MIAYEFKNQFNASIQDKDWSRVINLGEAYLAQNGPASEVVYNLGLAYLEVGNSQMAVSLFLSLPRQGAHASMYEQALKAALVKVGRNPEDLDMGAHGLTAIASQTLSMARTADYYASTAVLLPIVIGLIALRWFFRRRSGQIEAFKKASLLNFGIFGFGVLSIVSILFLVSSLLYRPTWCAVISEDSAVVRDKPDNDGAGLTTLAAGTPVLVLGDTRKAWIRVLESGGVRGWMDALQVRCVNGTK